MTQQENTKFITELPTQKFLLPYVVLALHKLGGKGDIKEVAKELNTLLDISDELLDELTPKRGTNRFLFDIRFARTRLVFAEYLLPVELSGYGLWELSDKGKEIVGTLLKRKTDDFLKFREEVWSISKKILLQRRKQRKEEKKDIDISQEHTQEDEIEQEIEQEEKKELEEQIILDAIKNMKDVYGFERLCVQLFKAVGYKDVEVTKASGDGGIDGYGFLVLGLVRFKVVFQAKRYRDIKISINDIKLLNQSKQDEGAEKAVFITTSYFTKEARKTANNLDVSLINGEELVQLLQEHKIGYRFDKRFLDEI